MRSTRGLSDAPLLGTREAGPRGRAAGPPARGTHRRPFCTTRFRQLRQQEQAWLHSKSKGGSAMLNSGSSRPSWGQTAVRAGHGAPRQPAQARTPTWPRRAHLVVPAAQAELAAHAVAGGAVVDAHAVLRGGGRQTGTAPLPPSPRLETPAFREPPPLSSRGHRGGVKAEEAAEHQDAESPRGAG